ncbi:MAG: histidine phosphatase family protein [Patescibacteria group bacterium]
MSMPRNIYLVRHGQSEGNLLHQQYRETKDISLFSTNFLDIHEADYVLTEKGIEQARLAGKWLKRNVKSTFARMLVSNNTRAEETAAYLGLEDAAWMIDHNLGERENGLFSVLTPVEIEANFKWHQKFHDSQPFLYRPPQGQSMLDKVNQIKIVLETLSRECSGKDVVIVCHGHVIRGFRILLEHMSRSEINEYLNTEEDWGRVPNCAIVHYTRMNPKDNIGGLHEYLNWVRVIRPAGGGDPEDDWRLIKRKKYSNEELLQEVEKCKHS